MSTLEARVSALERRQTFSEARIEEIALDMTTSFGQVSVYLKTIEDNNEKRFQSIETTLGEHTKILGEHTKILDDHTKRLGNIETLLTQILARLPENR